MAISLASKTAAHFETACAVALELLDRHAASPLGPTLLNVNVPDIPRETLKGYRLTRLGRRHKAENVIRTKSPRGETVYWVGAAGPAADAGEGTDSGRPGPGRHEQRAAAPRGQARVEAGVGRVADGAGFREPDVITAPCPWRSPPGGRQGRRPQV